MIYYLIMSHSCIVLLCFEIGSDDMDNGHGLRSPSLKNTAIYLPLSLSLIDVGTGGLPF